MTEEHIKEQLSQCYAHAVAAQAGIDCAKDNHDYGFDGTFKDIIKRNYDGKTRYVSSGISIDYQIKSTVNVITDSGFVKYDLEAKNYKDLISVEAGTPRILVLFLLPENRDEWIQVTGDQLILRKCAWWYSLKGLPYLKNKTSVRINIPDNQILTPLELKRLMDCVKRGEEL